MIQTVSVKVYNQGGGAVEGRCTPSTAGGGGGGGRADVNRCGLAALRERVGQGHLGDFGQGRGRVLNCNDVFDKMCF